MISKSATRMIHRYVMIRKSRSNKPKTRRSGRRSVIMTSRIAGKTAEASQVNGSAAGCQGWSATRIGVRFLMARMRNVKFRNAIA